jgi:S-adenosylmethionine hydrolase
LSADRQFFVAPDNGVLSVIYSQEENVAVRHITAAHYFREPMSNTFHGRDVFAPVAAWLSRRVESEKLGELVTDFVRFSPPQPQRVNERTCKGLVVRVDRFGTLITNFTPADLPELFRPDPQAFKMAVGKSEVTQLRNTYADAAQGELFAILGSSGYVEIAANRASAAQAVGAGKGAEVAVFLSPSQPPASTISGAAGGAARP